MEKALTVQTQTQSLIPIQDIERMAQAFAKSGLFGIKTVDQGIALMLVAQSQGLHPATAASEYHIIQGRPALKSDAMLARFQSAGGKVTWGAYTDQEVTGTFTHPQGGTVTVSWSISQAKAAGLTGKDVWKQYPRAMLRARVISEAIRTVYPGVSVGVYTVEEVQDFDAKPTAQEVVAEVEPAEPKAAPVLAPADPDRADLFARLKTSKWSKEELSKYSETVFGIGSAMKLKTEQLRLLISTSEKCTFAEAMEAEKGAKELEAEMQTWEHA